MGGLGPGIGGFELVVIGLVALLVVGPKDLPVLMRRVGQMVAKARSMAREFQAAFEDIARQSELEDLRKEIEDLKRNNAMTDAQADLANMESDINAAVMSKESAEAAAPTSEPKSKDDAA